jgi:hypothetical protein
MPAMDAFISTYHRLLIDAVRTGRCPVFITERGLARTDQPADRDQVLADLAARDVSEVLAGRWPGGCPCCNERLDPFHDEFPGLAPRSPVFPGEAVSHAARMVDSEYLTESALVRADRLADVPALIGWMGSFNSWQDAAGLSAVLRSWDERFGALMFEIDSATLELAVAAPPRTEQECLRIADEHIAFCWDAFDTYTGQITTVTLRYAPTWRFWWD